MPLNTPSSMTDLLFIILIILLLCAQCKVHESFQFNKLPSVNSKNPLMRLFKIESLEFCILKDFKSPHQGFFISRHLLNKIGPFDEAFSLSSDFDMTIRAIKASKNYYEFSDSVGSFRLGGNSSYSTFFQNFYIMRKHNVSLIKSVTVTVVSLLKYTILRNFRSSKYFKKVFKLYFKIQNTK